VRSGLLNTPNGFGAFKEVDNGIHKHYTILFPESGKGIMILTNSQNGIGIFKELPEVTMRDVHTPWEWENYIPYDIMGRKNLGYGGAEDGDRY
jgi:hypothetical protein